MSRKTTIRWTVGTMSSWSKKRWRKHIKSYRILNNKHSKRIIRKNNNLNIFKNIPRGYLCYDKNGLCKYWYSILSGEGSDSIAGCKLLNISDHDLNGCGLLHDHCKECGLNIGSFFKKTKEAMQNAKR